MVIRRAGLDDASAMAGLTTQLGYPADAATIERRLRAVLPLEDNVVLVAIGGHGGLVGWIHVGARRLLESDSQAEILGLVVDAAHRRMGVARRLVETAEHWAADQGVPVITVRSNVAREESHPFYEAAGYTRVKTQHVYRKPLPQRTSHPRRA